MTAIVPPDLPKLIVNGTSTHKYVFTYKNHWDKELKRAVRSKGDSHCVGRYVPVEGQEGYGEIFFNDDFKAQYPELEYLRVFRRKGGKLEFKAIDDDLCNVVRSQEFLRLHAGASWALNQIVASSALARALKKTFPDHKTYLRLLSLAYYLVINRDASLCHYEEFAECTWLPYARPLTSGSISRLLRKIDKNSVARFLKHLNNEYRREQGSAISERQFWALDSTSVSSYSGNISSVDYGHNKDLIDIAQTNVLLIVDQKSGAPIYYRNFDGNVPDVSTVRNTLGELAMMNIDFTNAVIVTDRGYGSAANWDDLIRSGMSFICNAKRHLNAAISELVQEKYSELLNWNNEISFINQTAVTVPLMWCYDEFPVKDKRKQKQAEKKLYVHIYRSEAIEHEMTSRLRTNLAEALKQYKTDSSKLSEAQKALINTYADEKEGEVSINMYKVNEKLRYAGVRVLVSDTVEDALQCCLAYEERNQVEYAFSTLKSRLNCNRTLVHSTDAWEGKLFLQMLATSIAIMVRARVKLYNQNAKKSQYRLFYDSDHKLLAKLNNIYMTKFKAGWLFDEVAGKRKELFKILNVAVPSAEKFVVIEQDEQPEEINTEMDWSELGIELPDEQLEVL